MPDKIYKIFCKRCRHSQQTIIRSKNIKGSRKCFFCNHSIALNKENLIEVPN